MGKYKFNRREAGLERVIELPEAQRTIEGVAKTDKRMGVLCSLLWLYGGRDNEYRRLRRMDLKIDDDYLRLDMPKSKRRSESENDIPHVLRVPLRAPFVEDLVLPFLEDKKDPSEILFPYSHQQIWRALKKVNPLVSAHWFRKSRLSQLSLEGATDSQLTAWAGWTSSAPAKHYIEYGGRLAAQLSDKVK